jgi:hypothetical protein
MIHHYGNRKSPLKHLTNIIVAIGLLVLSVMLIIHSFQAKHPRISILPPDRTKPRSIDVELKFINDKQDHILNSMNADSVRQIIPVAVNNYQKTLNSESKNTTLQQEWQDIRTTALKAAQTKTLPAGVYLNVIHVYSSSHTTTSHARLEMVLSQSTNHWFNLPLMDIDSLSNSTP